MEASHQTPPLKMGEVPASGSYYAGRNVAQAKLDVNAALTSGQAAALANPEGRTVIIVHTTIHVRTRNAASASTLDIGVAADGTTLSDTLIDGVSVAGAGFVYDSITDKGSNGGTRRLWGASEYVTASTATGDPNGMEGEVYVEYIVPNLPY